MPICDDSALSSVTSACGNRRRRIDAGFNQTAREVERVFIGLDDSVVEILQGILPAQLEIIFGEIGLFREALVFEIGGADLGGVLSLVNGIADAAPEIRLPGNVERQGNASL